VREGVGRWSGPTKRIPAGRAAEGRCRGGPRRRAEAACATPRAKEEVGLRGGGVVLGVVWREGGALGAIDGALGPVLGVAPGGGAGALELDGGLAVGFVLGEGAVEGGEDVVGVGDGEDGEAVDVADPNPIPD
jgi:hypothetical protein